MLATVVSWNVLDVIDGPRDVYPGKVRYMGRGGAPGVLPRLVFFALGVSPAPSPAKVQRTWSKDTPVAKIGNVAMCTWMLRHVTSPPLALEQKYGLWLASVIFPTELRLDLKAGWMLSIRGALLETRDVLAYRELAEVMVSNRTSRRLWRITKRRDRPHRPCSSR